MSATNGSTNPLTHENVNPSDALTFDKGKGKAVVAEQTPQDMSLGEEEDSSSEEEIDETTDVVEEPDDDNMEEIDTSNIISDGRRTRGRQIDFAKAAEALPEGDEDEDEDDDDDFVEPVADEDLMEE